MSRERNALNWYRHRYRHRCRYRSRYYRLETTSKFHGSSPHFRRAPPRLRQSPPPPEASPTPTQAACGADGARDSRVSARLHTRRAARYERAGPQHPNEPHDHESLWSPPVAPSRPQTALRSAPGGRRGRRPASSRAPKIASTRDARCPRALPRPTRPADTPVTFDASVTPPRSRVPSRRSVTYIWMGCECEGCECEGFTHAPASARRRGRGA